MFTRREVDRATKSRGLNLGRSSALVRTITHKNWKGIADCRAVAVADIEKVLQLWRRTAPSESKGYLLQTEFCAADNIPCSSMWRFLFQLNMRGNFEFGDIPIYKVCMRCRSDLIGIESIKKTAKNGGVLRWTLLRLPFKVTKNPQDYQIRRLAHMSTGYGWPSFQ